MLLIALLPACGFDGRGYGVRGANGEQAEWMLTAPLELAKLSTNFIGDKTTPDELLGGVLIIFTTHEVIDDECGITDGHGCFHHQAGRFSRFAFQPSILIHSDLNCTLTNYALAHEIAHLSAQYFDNNANNNHNGRWFNEWLPTAGSWVIKFCQARN